VSVSDEQRGRIKTLFHAEHWKVGTIASELGLHRDTVKNVLGTCDFVSRGRDARTSLLDPYRSFIVQVLKDHPRLRATRLYDMLEPRGYRGSRRQLRRYVSKVRPRPAPEAFLRIETLPGEEAQMDWGKFGEVEVPGGTRKLSCFAMVLPWSRCAYIHFTLDERMDTFLCKHVRAFDTFGGVPRRVLYDNLKSAVLERVGEHVRFHPMLLDFAGHYHFIARPCAPARGNEKGHVERFIRYLRTSFFPARHFDDVGDLNRQLARWLRERAEARVHPIDPDRRSVAEHMELERPRLLPLPAHPAHTDCAETLRSGKQPYLRFDCNDYSIPHRLVRKPLTLRADDQRVRIFDGSELVAEHARDYGKLQVIENAAHIDALVVQKRKASELRGRDRLRALCSHADALIDDMARRGEPQRAAHRQAQPAARPLRRRRARPGHRGGPRKRCARRGLHRLPARPRQPPSGQARATRRAAARQRARQGRDRRPSRHERVRHARTHRRRRRRARARRRRRPDIGRGGSP